MTPPPDEDFLEAHARETQTTAANHNTRGGDRCGNCSHGWHGVKCTSCSCPTAWRTA